MNFTMYGSMPWSSRIIILNERFGSRKKVNDTKAMRYPRFAFAGL